jgi:hypothetical protein
VDTRSIESAPEPLIMMTTAIATARMWNSKPSSFWLPYQFAKNPMCIWDQRNSHHHVARDAKRSDPAKKANQQSNAAKKLRGDSRAANGAGTFSFCVKNPIVPVKPYPPNQPKAFCAEWLWRSHPSCSSACEALAGSPVRGFIRKNADSKDTTV